LFIGKENEREDARKIRNLIAVEIKIIVW